MTRTSTGMVTVPPTLTISRSPRARRSLTWASGDSSPTSSRKIVPDWASSNFPIFSALASVKAPLVWPKNSDSISSLGMAPQFTTTNGPFCRGLLRWTARAISSLPVPLSPVMSTVPSTRAILSIIWKIEFIRALVPTMSENR